MFLHIYNRIVFGFNSSPQSSLRRMSHAQQTQNICIKCVHRGPTIFDVGPTLYKCYTNVLCLLGDNNTNNVYLDVYLMPDFGDVILITMSSPRS